MEVRGSRGRGIGWEEIDKGRSGEGRGVSESNRERPP